MSLLELHVLGRPFFDRRGLFLAFDDGRPVGFAHAAFGPNHNHTNIDLSTGVVCMLMVVPEYDNDIAAGNELLKACENYLAKHGTKRIYGGAVRPAAPFYMGLYGGSEPIGVFESDTLAIDLFRNSNYEKIGDTLLFRVSLDNYKIPITSKTVQWRRKISISRTDLPEPGHWWEACMMCNFVWLKLWGRLSNDPQPVGAVVVRITDSLEMPGFRSQPLQPADAHRHLPRRTHTAGLMNIEIREGYRNKGLAAYLMGEMIREVQKEHATEFEAHVAAENEPLVRLLETMHWNVAERGAIFCKKFD